MLGYFRYFDIPAGYIFASKDEIVEKIYSSGNYDTADVPALVEETVNVLKYKEARDMNAEFANARQPAFWNELSRIKRKELEAMAKEDVLTRMKRFYAFEARDLLLLDLGRALHHAQITAHINELFGKKDKAAFSAEVFAFGHDYDRTRPKVAFDVTRDDPSPVPSPSP